MNSRIAKRANRESHLNLVAGSDEDSARLLVYAPMSKPDRGNVCWLPHRRGNTPRLTWTRRKPFQTGSRPVWLRLKHFGRKILERFKSGFLFHRWSPGCYGRHSRLVSGDWHGRAAHVIFCKCLTVPAPQQFFGNGHDVVRLEAKFLLKFLERR